MCVATIGVVAALAVVLGAATPAGVETVATVRGGVFSFAQDGRYLAWVLPEPAKRVVMYDLRTGTTTEIPSTPLRGFNRAARFALAGDRAYWEPTSHYQGINQGDPDRTDAALVTASVRDPGRRQLDADSVLLPSAGDPLRPRRRFRP
jgi:hypothetical protein